MFLVPGLNSFLHPFYQPYEAGKALSVRPDIMEADEILEFPEFADVKKGQVINLSTTMFLTNSLVLLWASFNAVFCRPNSFFCGLFSCSQTKFAANILMLSVFFYVIFRLTDFLSDAFDFWSYKTG